MAYLRLKDYESLIDSSTLQVILDDNEYIRLQAERTAIEEVKSYIRHRYDVEKEFRSINDFALATTYYIGDRIEWTETAYDVSTSYNTDDRVSYGSYIWASLTDSNVGNTPEEGANWTQLAANESLWTCRVQSANNLPVDISYSSNAYYSRFDLITGWNKANTLYLKKYDDNIVRIYENDSDRSSDVDNIGYFEYPEEAIEQPVIVDIKSGTEKLLGGSIEIKGFIPDDTETDISATGYFELKDSRNAKLFETVIDVCLYHLHSRIQPRNIPELRKERYDGNDPQERGGALAYLKKVQKGTIELDIPTYSDKTKGQRVEWGSEPKQNLTAY